MSFFRWEEKIMAVCMNCGKKTGIRNPEYYLDSDMTLVLCGQCYNKLEHFKIKSEETDIQKFEETCKLVQVEMNEHEFNEKTKTAIILYMQKQRNKIERANFEEMKKTIDLSDINTHMLTTGYNFEGYEITDYLGVISGQSALGAGAFSGVSASASNFLGTESSYFGNRLIEAKENATREMMTYSLIKGGNAIIGVDFDYIVINGLITVISNGTSVKIKKK